MSRSIPLVRAFVHQSKMQVQKMSTVVASKRRMLGAAPVGAVKEAYNKVLSKTVVAVAASRDLPTRVLISPHKNLETDPLSLDACSSAVKAGQLDAVAPIFLGINYCYDMSKAVQSEVFDQTGLHLELISNKTKRSGEEHFVLRDGETEICVTHTQFMALSSDVGPGPCRSLAGLLANLIPGIEDLDICPTFGVSQMMLDLSLSSVSSESVLRVSDLSARQFKVGDIVAFDVNNVLAEEGIRDPDILSEVRNRVSQIESEGPLVLSETGSPILTFQVIHDFAKTTPIIRFRRSISGPFVGKLGEMHGQIEFVHELAALSKESLLRPKAHTLLAYGIEKPLPWPWVSEIKWLASRYLEDERMDYVQVRKHLASIILA
ncbi:MAG: hypothetical protein ACI9BD_000659 [Candidatus Marinamargulisbacteria bacterium]|jgi:hypothetical protein